MTARKKCAPAAQEDCSPPRRITSAWARDEAVGVLVESGRIQHPGSEVSTYLVSERVFYDRGDHPANRREG